MKKNSPQRRASIKLPVSKETVGGVAGAVAGSVVAGPVGAIVGAVAGTMMGSRAAKGKTLISSGTKATAKKALERVERMPVVKSAERKAKKVLGSVAKSVGAGGKSRTKSSGKSSSGNARAAKARDAAKTRTGAKSRGGSTARKAGAARKTTGRTSGGAASGGKSRARAKRS